MLINDADKMITIQTKPFGEAADNVHEISVSSRMNRVSGQPRPLVDTCGDRYSTILCIQEKIEISVYGNGDERKVVVRPLRFRLFETDSLDGPDDERLRLLSICAGAGIGTSMFCDSQYFSATMEVELEEDSVEVLKYNFPNSFLFNGDLRDCNTVAKADVAFVSLSCTEFSVLGDGGESYFDNLVLGTFRILKAAECRAIFFENVPSFFHSTAYNDLRDLLSNGYPYVVGPIQLESHDFGSVALRNRSYAVYFHEKGDFELFRVPKPPAVRHRKLKEFLDPRSVVHSWKNLDAWRDSFNKKAEKGNAWADRNLDKTFVDENASVIQCIARRYRSHSASNSYVLNDDKTKWRFLTVSELRRIFGIPEWFTWPPHIPITRIYEMIGQSVCGRVIRAWANELATVFFRRFAKGHVAKQKEGEEPLSLSLDQSGQIGFMFF